MNINNQTTALSMLLALGCGAALSSCGDASTSKGANSDHRNFVIIFCDDLGYGDLSCFGNPSIVTPELDRMAYEGQKWSSFYVSASVSSPSRGGLLTGRYGVRTGLYGDKRRVLFPQNIGGICDEEKTIAEYLQDAGYATACVGKWHVGCKEEQLPRNHGFDYYYGIPYSSDMSVYAKKNTGKPDYKWKLPLYNQSDSISTVEYEPDQHMFTEKFTDYAIDFIGNHKEEPFFLYLAHPMPHFPVYASEKFEGTSRRGIYGDVVEELDYNVGRLLDYLRAEGLDENTTVIFSSDNGPWLNMDLEGGCAAALRDGKASASEGGFRVPTIFWGADVKPNTLVTSMGSTLDLLPTFCAMADVPLLEDRVYDGFDIRETLKSGVDTEREIFYYYRGSEIFAVRRGSYKLQLTYNREPYYDMKEDNTPLPWLFNIDEDISERFNIADQHPEIVEELKALVEKQKGSFTKTPSQFDRQ